MPAPSILVGVVLLVAAHATAAVNVRNCAPEPASTEIAYGDWVTCEINPVGETDLFRFEAQAGEVITVVVGHRGGPGDPAFRLIEPDGNIGGYVPARVAGPVSWDYKLTKSGRYTIEVADGGHNQTLSYAIYVQRLTPASPGAVPLAFGQRTTATISEVSSTNLFAFDAAGNEVITVVVGYVDGPGDPAFRLIEPDGSIGGYVPARVRGPVSWDYNLSKAGRYTIEVADGGHNQALVHSVYLQRLMPAGQTAVPLIFGRPAEGLVAEAGSTRLHTFRAVSGDAVSVVVSYLSGDGDPAFRLIEPDGRIGGYVPARVQGPVSWDYKLTKTGQYTIEVADGGHNQTYAYRVHVQCIGSGCPVYPCTSLNLSPRTQILAPAAATGAVGVATAGCAYTARSDAAFLTLSGGSTGSGPGNIQFALTANNSPAPRTAAVTVTSELGEHVATITQSGTAPLLVVSPSPLDRTVREGATEVSDHVLSVYTNAASLAFTAEATTAGGGNWLAINTRSGTAPANVVATIDPAGVPEGTHTGSIVISAPTANPASRTIAVTLRVIAAGPPKLSIDSTGLVISVSEGAPPRVERRAVSNVGGGRLQFEASAITLSGAGWLQVTPDRGEATVPAPASLAVTIDPGRLPPGAYSGRITVKSAEDSLAIPVTVTVSAVQKSILLSQTGLAFTAVQKGGTTPPQNFGVLNTGSGQMEWTASALSEGGWLSVTPSSGVSDAGSLEVPLVDVAVDPANLAPGDYYGRVTVEAAGADNSPQYLSVVLTVLPPGSDPGPLVRPTGVIFTGVAGGPDPPPQTVRVTNLAGAPRTFAAGRLSIDGQGWFTSQPAGATVRPGQPVDVEVRVTGAALTPGIRRGVLTLLFQDGSIANVNILFVLISGGSAGAVTSRRYAEGCTPARLLPVISSLGSNFTVPAGWPSTIEARVVDDCGNPLVDGSVVASFSNGDPPTPLVSLKNGRWMRTWVPRAGSAAQVSVTVTAEIPGTGIQGAAQVSGALRANPEPPVVGAGGIVNSISYQGEPLAPGARVTIFGSKLKPYAGNVLALIGGMPMPLVEPPTEEQINAVVPYGLAVNTRHHLVIQSGDAYTIPEPVTVAAAQPAIRTKDFSGKGQGVISDSKGALFEPGNPAAAGAEMTILCAGLGEVDPTAEAGKPAAESPVSKPKGEVAVTVGGVLAQVLEAKLAPGQVGMYVVRATVPEGVTPGDAVPVVLTVAGQSSPPVTMSVR